MNTSLAIDATIVAGIAAAAVVLWLQYGPNSKKDAAPATFANVRSQLLLAAICSVALALEIAVFTLTRSLVSEAFVVAAVVLPSGIVVLRASFRKLPTPRRFQAPSLLIGAILCTVVSSMFCWDAAQEVLTKQAADASSYGPLAFALGLQVLALYPTVIYFSFARYLVARRSSKTSGTP